MTALEALAPRPPFPSLGGGYNKKMLEAHNIERVRSYLERNLGASRKETCRALNLHPRTVAKAIGIIRGRAA